MDFTWERFLEIAVFAMNRSDRFCEGFIDVAERKAESDLFEYFGDLNELHTNGLSKSFRKLSEKSSDWRSIAGLLKISSDIVLHKYITASGNTVNLTRKSIVDTLLCDYVDKYEIMETAKKCPVFSMYINSAESSL